MQLEGHNNNYTLKLAVKKRTMKKQTTESLPLLCLHSAALVFSHPSFRKKRVEKEEYSYLH